MLQLTPAELHCRAKRIRLLLLDVDGILTDGSLFYSPQGNEIKAFNTLDGHGIKLLQQSGVRVGIITGRQSEAVTLRAKNLGITIMAQGREDKYTALTELLESHADLKTLALDDIAFMGDDLPDLTIMTKAGLALSVPNGHSEVRQRAHWISQNTGGKGAVREACDFIMREQGTYEQQLAPYI